LRAGCPIVPVAVLGSRDVLPKGRRLPRWRTGIDIVYGTPFTVQVSGNPRSRSATAEATEQIRVRLLEHLTESRKRFATHE
jgi:1-acyl-sn-glycerol-3-phosphate acyltransferase